MSESLLNVLKLLLLALVYLFFIRVLRTMWLQVTAPPVAASPANDPTMRGTSAPATAHLRVVDGPEPKGKTFDLGDEVTVGRASGCQVALTDPAVSQLHARIFRRDGRLFIEDLGSSNGTYVNRKKVAAAIAIRRGDRIVVGGTVLEVTK